MTLSEQAIAGYASAAPELIARWGAIDTHAWLAPVLGDLPASPARVLDVGAGTGGAAQVMLAHGYAVTAVEPVAAFVAQGEVVAPYARWIADKMPVLSALGNTQFDVILCLGVWHHLDAADQSAAMVRLSELAADGAVVVFALRHGPAPAGRPAVTLNTDDVIALAECNDLLLEGRRDAGSVQAGNATAGVTWTWLTARRKARI